MLQPHAEALMDTAVSMAKLGDTAALKLCLDRLMPPIREERVRVNVPLIDGPDSCTVAQASVLNAVAKGEMLPSEGQALSGLIDAQRRAYETSDHAKRLMALEELLKGKP
jgi:hypothetical protein